LFYPSQDDALKKGMDVTRVRKTAQTIALCGPATFMAAASLVSYNGDDGAASSGFATVALLTLGLSLSSFSYAGLYCNHQVRPWGFPKSRHTVYCPSLTVRVYYCP
tara:strand:+ start:7757 stop:8074 length:318 start_codon:yes stop_codon:yes gene_type:complete